MFTILHLQGSNTAIFFSVHLFYSVLCTREAICYFMPISTSLFSQMNAFTFFQFRTQDIASALQVYHLYLLTQPVYNFIKEKKSRLGKWKWKDFQPSLEAVAEAQVLFFIFNNHARLHLYLYLYKKKCIL